MSNGRGRTVPKRDLRWLFGMALLVVAGDWGTKSLISQALRPGDSVPLIPPVLSLTYVQNTGAAFGVFKGYQHVLIVLSVAVVVWIVREWLRRPPSVRAMQWGCALVMGGAIGNLIDRVRLGYVIDFIDLRVWPVFNLADSAITIGVSLLIWHALFGSRT